MEESRLRSSRGVVRFSSYQTDGFYDEMFQTDDVPRPQARLLLETLPALRLLKYTERRASG